jgi:hypothetical protein
LAYGLSKIHTSSLAGWRFIFIVEGAITIAAALVAWFFIVDFPQLAKFLTGDERARAVERLNKDRGDGEHDQITGAKIIQHLSDWKLWGFALVVCTPWLKMLMPSSLEPQLHVTLWPILLRIIHSNTLF